MTIAITWLFICISATLICVNEQPTPEKAFVTVMLGLVIVASGLLLIGLSGGF